MTPAQVHQAMNALLAQVRWWPVPRPDGAGEEDLPYATHEGVLHLPGLGDLPCYRLNTGERVFEAAPVLRLLGLAESEGLDG